MIDDLDENLLDTNDADGGEDIATLLTAAGVPVPRYYCAGSKRVDPFTGKKFCTYKAHYPWSGPCPGRPDEVYGEARKEVLAALEAHKGCGGYYACLPNKKGKNATRRETLGEETMSKVKPMVYHSTGIPELDRVLGGGVVYEKLLMFAAPQGSGKSTMLLQACDGFATGGKKSYFATGEMTQAAVKDYALRLGIKNENLALFGDPRGVDVEDLFEDVVSFGAKFLVIDSLPVACVSDVKGDIGQPTMMDAVINMLSSFCQEKKRTAIIINHLNKDEDYSGSRKVKFLVDGLLRMDYHSADYDEKGTPIGVAAGVRKIYMDAKSRQGRADQHALVELTDQGIRPVSLAATRAISSLRLA